MNRTERRRQQRRRDRRTARKPVTSYTAAELTDMLVADAKIGVATPLDWAVGAYQRIAHLERVEIDTAYVRVREAVRDAGAVMPGAPRQ